MTAPIIIPFDSPDAAIQSAGGKGANLARLTRAGFAVPRGFIISTAAYRTFVENNRLDEQIRSTLKDLPADDAAELERASEMIRLAFSSGTLIEDLAGPISAAYQSLGGDPVAVRSSATAEDLPDVSFAGQQDTFLNIIGEQQVLEAVIACWSSLWTARAIGYRLRNHIDHEDLALAVVVQQMVQSDVSGVMFTANPLTGLRSETVIDATLGLGEALVSGQVEPDHYVIDTLNDEIVSKTAGAKSISTRGRAGGGVETVSEQASDRLALSDEQIRALARLGGRVEQEYGFPQDIEWAYAGGDLYLLQARPITSLFPIPRESLDPLFAWFSLGAFQGMVGPMTPLGQECLQRISLGVAEKLGIPLKFEDQQVLEAAGSRIWMNISDVIRHPLGNRLLGGFMSIGEPGSALILKQITSDPRLGAGQGRLRISTVRRVLHFMLPGLKEIPTAIVRPEEARARFDARLDAYLKTVRIPGGADRFERLASAAAFLDNQGGAADALRSLLVFFMPIMAPSLALLNLIGHLLPKDQDHQRGISMRALDLTRGLPGNVTIEMDLLLWQVATETKQDAASEAAFVSADARALAGRYLRGELPPAAQEAVRDFLERYGMRCAGEIDLGQPRWREDPTPILLTLQSYLQITEENSPPLHHAQNARAAEEAIERMAAEVRAQPGGRIKEKILRSAARRVRLLLGARESPKFYMVQTMGVLREVLLKIGEEFASAGTILNREDFFYLHVSELKALSRGEARDWQALIANRRLAYERELRRRQMPRVLVSDGRAFYEGFGSETSTSDVITGSPVSPGVVEGVVHVVFDPHEARLLPGEILVCAGTDPAWTPLFMAAGGLVTEVGGMMTHGSVVAREYGIPAVVGVHEATQRLKNGQRIRLDGSAGKITLME